MARYCIDCGKKFGILEEVITSTDGSLLCRSCYEQKLADLKRKELEEKKRLKMEKRKKTIERNKRKKEIAKKREKVKLYGKKQEQRKWKEKGISNLIRELGNKRITNRRKAAYTLGLLGDRRAVRPLIEALKDRDMQVVATSISALGKIGDSRALDDLRKICNKRNVEPLILRRGISAIDKLKRIKFERMAKVVDANLKEMSWQDFEDTVTEALNAVPGDTRTSDMGIDGIAEGSVPIQIKQSERIGRNVVDNFETALRRYYPPDKKKIRGIIVAFSFTKGAYEEANRAKREDNIDINLLIVDKLVS